MNQKPSEVGWFYHAPAKKVEKEPVGAPPASQIPGLGDVSILPPEQVREMVFRDTDSKYIQLAKMGGRKDLLTIRPNSGTQKEAKCYPRNEWFYLEDNAQQMKTQQDTQEPWKFLLPEYMVHQSMGQSTLPEKSHSIAKGPSVPMRPAPFATGDQVSPRSSKGQGKPEKPRHCKEVRMGKLASSRNKPVYDEIEDARPRLRGMPNTSERDDPTNMSKLLAYTYQREWHNKHKVWEEKEKATNRGRRLQDNKSENRASPEPSKSGRTLNADENNNQTTASQKEPEKEKQEPFKLTRFKNVQARVETHRSTHRSPAAKAGK